MISRQAERQDSASLCVDRHAVEVLIAQIRMKMPPEQYQELSQKCPLLLAIADLTKAFDLLCQSGF